MNNQEQHITSEQIQRYVSHRMNEKERAAFETKLEKDPFAKEAVEGFNLLSDPQDGDLLYASTTALISAKAGLPSKGATGAKMVSLYKIGAIAASVTLLIASAFWINNLFNNADSTMAEATDSYIEEENIDTKVENSENIAPVENGVGYIDSVLNLGEDEEIADDVLQISDIELVSEIDADDLLRDNKNDSNETATLSANSPESIIIEEEAEIEEEIAQAYGLTISEDELVESPTVVTTEQFKKETPGNRSSDDKQTLGGVFYDSQSTTENDESIVPSPKDETTIYKHGLALFQAGEYTDAITAFEETIRNKQHLDEAHYYQGLCYYYLGKYVKATKHLDLMITNGTPFKANAQWYKADMLLKKGKIEEAKVIFQELAAGNSSFKELAQEKLDTL